MSAERHSDPALAEHDLLVARDRAGVCATGCGEPAIPGSTACYTHEPDEALREQALILFRWVLP